MNYPCIPCKGKGAIQKDGKNVGNRQPYTVTCPECNGIGHHRAGRLAELALPED